MELTKADQRAVVYAKQADTIINTLIQEMGLSRDRMHEVIEPWGKYTHVMVDDFTIIGTEHRAILGTARALVAYIESLYTTREMMGETKDDKCLH